MAIAVRICSRGNRTMNETIIVALVTIIGSAMAAFVWLVKFLVKEVKMSIDKNSVAYDKVAEATRQNTEMTQETLNFMRNLNGRLADITAEKMDRKIRSRK